MSALFGLLHFLQPLHPACNNRFTLQVTMELFGGSNQPGGSRDKLEKLLLILLP